MFHAVILHIWPPSRMFFVVPACSTRSLCTSDHLPGRSSLFLGVLCGHRPPSTTFRNILQRSVTFLCVLRCSTTVSDRFRPFLRTSQTFLWVLRCSTTVSDHFRPFLRSSRTFFGVPGQFTAVFGRFRWLLFCSSTFLNRFRGVLAGFWGQFQWELPPSLREREW